MKHKFAVLFLLLCLLLGLAGCAQQAPAVYEATRRGQTFTVDTENHTITHGQDIYYYRLSGSTIEIHYPNGASYWFTVTKTGGMGGWDGDYNTERYLDGSLMADELEQYLDGQKTAPAKNWLLILAVAAMGVWELISPETAWYLSHGWLYRDAEPSAAALVVGRISGVIALVLAVCLALFF